MGHITQINERASNPLRAKLHAAAAVAAAANSVKRHAGGTTSIRVALRGTP